MSFKRTADAVIGRVNPAECLQQLVSAYASYKMVAEEEKTKRRGIEAWETTSIEQIQVRRDLLMEYLDRSFDERAQNFRLLFEQVDQAMVTGNNEQLALTLNAIIEIAKSSPFRDLASLTSVQTALDDPDHHWEF